MKKKLLLFTCFIGLFAFSQQKGYKIDWDGFQNLSIGNYSINIPAFNKENFSFDLEEGLQFVAQWKSSTNIDETNVVLTNVSYSVISAQDLKDLDLTKIPEKLVYQLKNAKARNEQFAFFQLSGVFSIIAYN